MDVCELSVTVEHLARFRDLCDIWHSETPKQHEKKEWHFWWVHCKHVSDWLLPPKITKYIFGDSEYCVYDMVHEKEFKNRWRDWQCKKFKYLKKMRPRVSWCVTQNGVVISVTASLQCFTNRKRTTIRKLGVRLLAPLRIPLWKFVDRTALSSRKESGNNFIWLTFGGRCGIDICCVKRPNESALQPVALSLIVF